MSIPKALEWIALLSYINGGSNDSDGTLEDTTYILEDESGATMYGVLVDSETKFDATANDIRLGKTAVTDTGATTGTKDIPAYHTIEGVRAIPSGSYFNVKISDWLKSDYTKLQALFCEFNTTLANSVRTTTVAIDGKTYLVNSIDELSTITVDVDSGTIKFNVLNDSGKPFVIRYFAYKEEP